MATKNYEYLAELELDPKRGIYNLFITTYNGLSVNLFVFIVEKKHEMLLHLISNEIYQTTEYVGSLCQLNNILNPFSIRQNDILFYANENDLIDLLKVSETIRQSGIDELVSTVKSDLIKVLKKKKPDALKKKFNDKRNEDELPPTVLLDNSPMSVVENNKIKIAPNLFKNPKQEPVAIEPTTTSVSTATSNQQQEDTTERVLINRYIKLINN